MSTNQPLLTNVVLVDYLRLATFDHCSYLSILTRLRMQGTGWRGAKWLQYKGQRSAEGFFYGIGRQGKRSHCIIQASGSQSHKLFLWLLRVISADKLPFYCTRIDLQRTKPGPDGFNHLAAYKRVQGKKSVIVSDTGSTLYLGARTSDSFWRIYDKTSELLRVELELKGRQAKRTWASLMAGLDLGGIWNTYLLRSKVPNVLVENYRDAGEAVELDKLTEVEDLDGKLTWLASLDALVFKLANDHDLGQKTHELISRWAEYGQNHDKTLTNDNN